MSSGCWAIIYNKIVAMRPSQSFFRVERLLNATVQNQPALRPQTLYSAVRSVVRCPTSRLHALPSLSSANRQENLFSRRHAFFGDTMRLLLRLRPHMIEAGRCGASPDKTGPPPLRAHTTCQQDFLQNRALHKNLEKCPIGGGLSFRPFPAFATRYCSGS